MTCSDIWQQLRGIPTYVRCERVSRRFSPVVTVLILAILICEIFADGSTFATSLPWVVALLEIIALAALWIQPLAAVVTLTMLWSVLHCMVEAFPSFFALTLGTMIAWTVGGYINVRFSVILLGITGIPCILFTDGRYSGYCCAAALLVLVGLIMRLCDRSPSEENAAVAQGRGLAQSVAVQLHDETCNELVYAMQCLQNDSIPRLDEANASMECALLSVRRSIHDLRSEENAGHNCAASSMCVLPIRSMVKERHERLKRTGFHGILVIDGLPDSVMLPTGLESLVRGFVHELFGNIFKHADAGQDYIVVAGIEGDRLSFSVTDVPVQCCQASQCPDGYSQSSGLVWYKEQFINAGGTFTLCAHDGLWSLDMSLPLNGRRHCAWLHGGERRQSVAVE